jgi:hypothetical protein
MFKYFETLDNTLEIAIWSALILIIIGLAGAVIYKILTAEKIKAGPIEITDEAAPVQEIKKVKK